MSEALYLAHHGVKGQKWGVRRYQNYDGTLTPEGRRYYSQEHQGVVRRIKEHTNVGDTGRRSAAASAKSSFTSQAKWGTVAAIGTLGAGAFLGTPIATAAMVAGAEYVATLGAATAVGAVIGRSEGRHAARQQNRAFSSQVISGNNFVVSQLTATTTVNFLGPVRTMRTSISSRR